MAAPKGNTYYQLVKNWKPGADRKYSPDELWKKAIEYFEWVEKNPLKEQKAFGTGLVLDVDKKRAMTIQGLCVFANISSSAFYLYEEDEAYMEIIRAIRDVIFTQKFEGAAAGLLEGNIISRELGLADKKDITTDGEKINTPQITTIHATCGGSSIEFTQDDLRTK